MSLEPSKQKRWTEEEILKLLCLLNENIEYIRAEFEADKKRGINVAANVLSEAIGNDCTPSRVRGKLEHLWENAGPPGGRKFKSSDSLYRFGGWTRTLPSLDAMFPGMLDNIALAGQGKQQ
jgi:hypothetical protein